MEKQHVDGLIASNQSLERSKSKLESMKQGAYCIHNTWGFGQIKSYNEAENRLIVDFENGPENKAIDPVFALKILNILRDDDLVVMFKKNPQEISARLKEDPLGMIIEFLQTQPNEKATAGDIEAIFENVVGKTAFKRWWTSIKKMAANDSRLMLIEDKITVLFLRENPISIEMQIVEDFDRTKNLGEKVVLAEKFIKLATNLSSLSDQITHIIADLKFELDRDDKRITIADKLCAYWVCEELNAITDSGEDNSLKLIELIISSVDSLDSIVESLPTSRYKNLFALITRSFPDEWEKYCLKILKNGNERVVNECTCYMIENGRGENVRDMIEKWLSDKSMRSAILHWIIKNRNTKKFDCVISRELLCPALLKAIFLEIDNDSLQVGSAKKIPLAELVCSDRSLIADLLEKASDEVVLDLAQVLITNQGFDSLSKKSLLARFIGVCPAVQNLITGKNKAQDEERNALKVSKWSLEAKKKEYEILVKKKIPDNKLAIEVAREHGDLKENSEYKMARQDQETLMARKIQLQGEFDIAEVVDFDSVGTDHVSLGNVVTIRQNSNNEVMSFAILGAWDSDPDNDIISYKTPIAQALLGKKVGDIADVSLDNTNEKLHVEAIGRWVDLAKK